MDSFSSVTSYSSRAETASSETGAASTGAADGAGAVAEEAERVVWAGGGRTGFGTIHSQRIRTARERPAAKRSFLESTLF
jgi:hypothetical protein